MMIPPQPPSCRPTSLTSYAPWTLLPRLQPLLLRLSLESHRHHLLLHRVPQVPQEAGVTLEVEVVHQALVVVVPQLLGEDRHILQAA